MERAVRAADDRHLELGARPEQRPVGQRLAVRVGDDRPALLEAERRRGQVVGRVVQHRAAADALELRARRGHVGDDPRARARRRRRTGRSATRVMSNAAEPELERAAADRRRVDQVADHLDRDRAPGGRGSRRSRTSGRSARWPTARTGGRLDQALAALGQEDGARRDLDDAADRRPRPSSRPRAAARRRSRRSTTRGPPSPGGCRRSGRRSGRCGRRRARPGRWSSE